MQRKQSFAEKKLEPIFLSLSSTLAGQTPRLVFYRFYMLENILIAMEFSIIVMWQSRISFLILMLTLIIVNQNFSQDSQNCTLVGRWADGPCYAVDVKGSIAFFGNGGYLEIVDFFDPANSVELAKFLTPSVMQAVVVRLYCKGHIWREGLHE